MDGPFKRGWANAKARAITSSEIDDIAQKSRTTQLNNSLCSRLTQMDFEANLRHNMLSFSFTFVCEQCAMTEVHHVYGEQLDDFFFAIYKTLPNPAFEYWKSSGHARKILEEGFNGLSHKVNPSAPHFGYESHFMNSLLFEFQRNHRYTTGCCVPASAISRYAPNAINPLHTVLFSSHTCMRTVRPPRQHLYNIDPY